MSAEYSVAFRLPRQWVGDALEDALEGWPDGAQVKSMHTLVANGCDGSRIPDDQDWSSATVLLPVCWLYGPARDLRVEMDGNPAVPLTRYQTADAVSRALAPLLHSVLSELGTGIEVLNSEPVLAELLWCIAATDIFAIADDETAPFLTQNGDQENADLVIGEWMKSNARHLDAGADAAIDALTDTIRNIYRRSIHLLRRRFADTDPPPVSFRTPLWNPLVMQEAFLRKRLYWDRRYEVEPERVDADAVQRQFIELCERHLALLKWLNEDKEGLAALAANALREQLEQLSVAWPVLVSSALDVESPHIVTYRLSLTSKCSSRELRCHLSRNDAISYHIEVALAHQELELVANGGAVEVPQTDFGGSWRKRLFAHSRLATRFPFYRIPAHEYFHRADQSGPVHCFYEAPPDVEGYEYPGERVGDERHWGGSQLIVRYRLLPYVWLTNIGLASVLVLASAYLLIVSLLTAGGTTGIQFTDVFKSMIPVHLGTVLLFTIERHNNPLVARRLKTPWYLVIGATTVAVAALVGWASVHAEVSLPLVSQFIKPIWVAVGEWLVRGVQ